MISVKINALSVVKYPNKKQDISECTVIIAEE